MGKKHFIIPIFVPHHGCPHNCVFCNQKKITGSHIDVTQDYIRETIKNHLATFPKSNITVEVAFYGGSFTGIEKTIQKRLLAVPFDYKSKGLVHCIRLSTRPDYIDEEILSLLKEYDVDTIELGIQSLHDDVLKKSGRGHNSQQVYLASELIKEHEFNLGLQMMIGLVDDSREKAISTGQEFIKLNPFCVRIYPTLVIKGTFLEKMYKNNNFTPLALNEAVELSAHLLMLFEYHYINVIRIGLQPTENINIGGDVIAGPFHPSFRQLAESYIYRIVLRKYLDGLGQYALNNHLIIKVNKKIVSNLVGQKSYNTNYLMQKYKLKSVKVYESDIEEDVVLLSIGELHSKLFKREIIGEYLKEEGLIGQEG